MKSEINGNFSGNNSCDDKYWLLNKWHNTILHIMNTLRPLISYLLILYCLIETNECLKGNYKDDKEQNCTWED